MGELIDSVVWHSWLLCGLGLFILRVTKTYFNRDRKEWWLDRKNESNPLMPAEVARYVDMRHESAMIHLLDNLVTICVVAGIFKLVKLWW